MHGSTGAKKLDADTIETFQRQLGDMGHKLRFVTLAGFHALNFAMFDLARGYRERGMAAYSCATPRSLLSLSRGRGVVMYGSPLVFLPADEAHTPTCPCALLG